MCPSRIALRTVCLHLHLLSHCMKNLVLYFKLSNVSSVWLQSFLIVLTSIHSCSCKWNHFSFNQTTPVHVFITRFFVTSTEQRVGLGLRVNWKEASALKNELFWNKKGPFQKLDVESCNSQCIRTKKVFVRQLIWEIWGSSSWIRPPVLQLPFTGNLSVIPFSKRKENKNT